MLRIIINIIIITAPFQNTINGLKASTMSTHKNEPPKEVQVSCSFYKYCVPFFSLCPCRRAFTSDSDYVALLRCMSSFKGYAVFVYKKKKGLWQRLEHWLTEVSWGGGGG